MKAFDKFVTQVVNKYSLPVSRFAIFLIYFWFGVLKLFSLSPANPLVAGLLEKTLPFVSFNQFIIFLGVVEMIIGILFLVPKLEKLASAILIIHMLTTFGPLLLVPAMSWQNFLVPTLEGQYILKNFVTLALVMQVLRQTAKK
ncbi:MAG TPA: hypothetical protein VLF68_02035 [Candidatus Saccharimonadales bacterium]|nr:hypothetical protein [Candidatus Saccharimonadales bacterium]